MKFIDNRRRRHLSCAMSALLFGSVLFPQQLPAQSSDMSAYAGQWGCRYSMQPFSGNALDTHYWEYGLALYQTSQYQLQGFYYSPSIGQVQVNGQGSWQIVRDGPRGLALSMQGQILRHDSGWMAFNFVVTPTSDRSMYYQFRGNTHMTNITCDR